MKGHQNKMNIDWKPIETAPKDRRILLFCSRVVSKIHIGEWKEQVERLEGNIVYDASGWWMDGFDHPFNKKPFMPTHWDELPEFPENWEDFYYAE